MLIISSLSRKAKIGRAGGTEPTNAGTLS